MKAEAYNAMALINQSFLQIVQGLTTLRKIGVLDEEYVFNQQTATNELCAKINCHILTKISEREKDDRNHYGKMRAALEKRGKR